MNLGSEWVACLSVDGHDVVHWSSVGEASADDGDIMRWAAAERRAVLTADLDFGKLLAATRSPWPSVVQLRTRNTLVRFAGDKVRTALSATSYELEDGALLTIHSDRFRIRPLPLGTAL